MHGHDLCFNLIMLKIDIHVRFMIISGVSRISFRGGVQNIFGKVGVFAWCEAPCSARLLGGFGGTLARENF